MKLTKFDNLGPFEFPSWKGFTGVSETFNNIFVKYEYFIFTIFFILTETIKVCKTLKCDLCRAPRTRPVDTYTSETGWGNTAANCENSLRIKFVIYTFDLYDLYVFFTTDSRKKQEWKKNRLNFIHTVMVGGVMIYKSGRPYF